MIFVERYCQILNNCFIQTITVKTNKNESEWFKPWKRKYVLSRFYFQFVCIFCSLLLHSKKRWLKKACAWKQSK